MLKVCVQFGHSKVFFSMLGVHQKKKKLIFLSKKLREHKSMEQTYIRI